MTSPHPLRCSICGESHDLFSIEPRLRLPDACLGLAEPERAARLEVGDDWVRLRDAGGRVRYFLRILIPFPVHGETRRFRWSAWAEVEEPVYWRVMELWEDHDQRDEPRLQGRLANALEGDERTLGLVGEIELVAPDHAPRFWIDARANHSLAASQRTGVPLEQVLAWLDPLLHRGG